MSAENDALIAIERVRNLRARLDLVPHPQEPHVVADIAEALDAALRVCECPPCPGRGNDGHGLTHCAECCFGTGVEADPDCPIHGLPTCEGWACQSCGADNFIPSGFARVIPPDSGGSS